MNPQHTNATSATIERKKNLIGRALNPAKNAVGVILSPNGKTDTRAAILKLNVNGELVIL
jgi:hypothetical protein